MTSETTSLFMTLFILVTYLQHSKPLTGTNTSRTLRPYQISFWLPVTAHAFHRSRSFKVVMFCTNRKLLYDLLLVIICDLGSISNIFRDIAPRLKSKSILPYFGPNNRGTSFDFCQKTNCAESPYI